MEDLIDDMNEVLKDQETEIIAAIVALLEARFNRLLPRIYSQLQNGQLLLGGTDTTVTERIQPLSQGEKDEFLNLLERLLQQSTAAGLGLAAELSKPVVSSPLAVSISAATVDPAARRARGYLEQYGKSFSDTVSGLMTQGLVAGVAANELTELFRKRLEVVKSRTTVLVRTESLKAFNDASRSYYSQNGVQLVVYYATPDERTCPFCAAQAGRVFKLGAIHVPRHPQCRCVLAPYANNQYETSAPYDRNRRAHRAEVLRYAKSKGVQLKEGPAYFEQLGPIPTRKDGQS